VVRTAEAVVGTQCYNQCVDHILRVAAGVAHQHRRASVPGNSGVPHIVSAPGIPTSVIGAVPVIEPELSGKGARPEGCRTEECSSRNRFVELRPNESGRWYSEREPDVQNCEPAVKRRRFRLRPVTRLSRRSSRLSLLLGREEAHAGGTDEEA
jgi:hypothetical protein